MALVVSVFVCLLIACDKDNIAARKRYGSGCIERLIVHKNEHAISDANVKTVDALFKNNNIDNSSFRYYDYVHDSLQTYYAPYALLDEKVVRVNQYVNGLRLLPGDISYVFLENKLSGVGGEPSAGTSLDTRPHLSLDELRTLFLNSAEAFDGAGEKFKDT